MIKLYWLRRTLDDVPDSDAWLSAPEQQRLHTLRIPKRRADWRLGRWTAKQAVSACLHLPFEEQTVLAQVEIRAADSGAPEAFVCDLPAGGEVSISHRDGVCICAVAPHGVDLGCDVETIEPHSAEFIADYLNVKELSAIASAPAPYRMCSVSLIWSAKESALKALKLGLRADIRTVQVSLGDREPGVNEWNPLQVTAEGRLFAGWWKRDDTSVYTFVADPPMSQLPLLIDSEMQSSLAANF